MFQDIQGHKNQTEFLSRSLSSGKLAHAYLFAGPANVGKTTVARRFIQALLCEGNNSCNACDQCRTFVSAANADFLQLDSGEAIKVEHVRDLIYKLSLKPYMAKYKAALIVHAELMTIEAANALLKSLEEPKGYTVIVLVTDNPQRLPKTILSRVQTVNFGLVEGEPSGRPGIAKRIAAEPAFAEKISALNESLAVFRSDDLAGRLKMAYELADKETPEIAEALEFWTSGLQEVLHKEPESSVVRKLKGLNGAQSYLRQNVNAKLLLFDLMLNTSK